MKCWCGCGHETKIFRGRPNKYIFNHHNRGKHHSEKVKEKIRCGNKGKIRSELTKNKIKNTKKGPDNPSWLGGISFLPYCFKFNSNLKEAIRNRDNETCQLCGEMDKRRKLSVHHIHYDKENCYPDLISLCKVCNSKVNFNRKYYEDLFMNILNERFLLFWTRRMNIS